MIKSAICKNVAKNGYYTQIKNTVVSLNANILAILLLVSSVCNVNIPLLSLCDILGWFYGQLL